ncbi:hypothetical protein NW757_007910 [Fusarium falciforme]|nr:hypothetical protein NW757_007910 [Fusarium falciforme]
MSCSCGSNTICPNGSSSEKPTDVEMQAVTAILNPDTTARDAKVTVSQSLPNRTLGFEQVEFTKRKLETQRDGDVQGYYEAPYRMPLFSKPSRTLSRWFTMTLREGDNYYIYEKNLSNPEEGPTRVSKTNNSMENADLMAIYDGNYGWVAYQTKSDGDDDDSEIQVIRLGASATGHVIADSSQYLDNKLAEFSAADSNKDSKEMIHLYFRGQGNLLYRSSSEVTGGRANFSKPDSLPGPVKLAPFTSLSVVPSPKPDQKLNVIYALKWGGKGQVTVFEDKWV